MGLVSEAMRKMASRRSGAGSSSAGCPSTSTCTSSPQATSATRPGTAPRSTSAASRSCSRLEPGGIESAVVRGHRGAAPARRRYGRVGHGDVERRRATDLPARGDRGRASRQPHLVRRRQGVRLGTPVLQGGPEALRRRRAAAARSSPCARPTWPTRRPCWPAAQGVLHHPPLRRLRRRARRAAGRRQDAAARGDRGRVARLRARQALAAFLDGTSRPQPAVPRRSR